MINDSRGFNSLKNADFQDNREYHYYKNDISRQFNSPFYFHLYLAGDMNLLKDPSIFPDKLLPKLKAGQNKLLIDFCKEPDWEIIDLIYEDLVIKKDIPAQQITLLCSSFDYRPYVNMIAKKYDKRPIGLIFSSYFERMAKNLYLANVPDNILSPLVRDQFERRYINLNRRWKAHRLGLLSLLYSKNLIDKGYNSFPLISECVEQAPLDRKKYIKGFFVNTKKGVINNDMTDDDMYNLLFDEALESYPEIREDIEKGRQVKNILPLKVDSNHFADDESKHLAYTDQKPLLKFARSTYFTVVTETNFNNNSTRQLTEKTFKPVFYKHPFILLSPPKSLEILKHLGYKTFHPYIDESYDNEHNDGVRLKMILNEIERLSNLNATELKDFCEKLLPIVEHNFQILKNKKQYIEQI